MNYLDQITHKLKGCDKDEEDHHIGFNPTEIENMDTDKLLYGNHLIVSHLTLSILQKKPIGEPNSFVRGANTKQMTKRNQVISSFQSVAKIRTLFFFSRPTMIKRYQHLKR